MVCVYAGFNHAKKTKANAVKEKKNVLERQAIYLSLYCSSIMLFPIIEDMDQAQAMRCSHTNTHIYI